MRLLIGRAMQQSLTSGLYNATTVPTSEYAVAQGLRGRIGIRKLKPASHDD